ncbi:MAG TPA: VOC family protein [Chloroflexia bacterium]|nr:VOC family protein [Chloroflexia bacterium]
MAIKNVSSVTLHVGNTDKAIDFWVNKCGFELRSDQPFEQDGKAVRWVEVAPAGAQTVVILAEGYGGWTEDSPGKFGGMVFWAEDMKGTHEEMAAKGVEFVEPPTVQPWGLTQALFKDQDGTTIVMVGNS